MSCFEVCCISFRMQSSCVIILYLISFLNHRRIPLELIPEEEAECAAWIHKLYQEKVRAVLKAEVWWRQCSPQGTV